MTGMRHAIFDLDGTLVDSIPGIGWSIDQALTACGLPACKSDLRPLIGPPIRSILAKVSGIETGPALDRLEQAFRSSYDSSGWRRTELYKGAGELLEDFQGSGVGLWVVTNKPALAAGKILAHLGTNGFFRAVVSRDSRRPVYESKAEALADLIRRRGLSRHECVLIGDTREDANAAAEAEIGCVIVSHGYGSGTFSSEPDWTEVRNCFICAEELAGARVL